MLYFSTNKLVVGFQNCFDILSRLWQVTGYIFWVKRRFLISSIAVDKTSLCRRQHFVRELQVEWPWSKS
jgi:hypothetical protein